MRPVCTCRPSFRRDSQTDTHHPAVAARHRQDGIWNSSRPPCLLSRQLIARQHILFHKRFQSKQRTPLRNAAVCVRRNRLRTFHRLPPESSPTDKFLQATAAVEEIPALLNALQFRPFPPHTGCARGQAGISIQAGGRNRDDVHEPDGFHCVSPEAAISEKEAVGSHVLGASR